MKGRPLGDNDNCLPPLRAAGTLDYPRAPSGLPAIPGTAGLAAGPFSESQRSPVPAGRADGTSRPAQVVAPAPAYRNSPTPGAPTQRGPTEPAPRPGPPRPARPPPPGLWQSRPEPQPQGRKPMSLGESHGEAGVGTGLGSGRGGSGHEDFPQISGQSQSGKSHTVPGPRVGIDGHRWLHLHLLECGMGPSARPRPRDSKGESAPRCGCEEPMEPQPCCEVCYWRRGAGPGLG